MHTLWTPPPWFHNYCQILIPLDKEFTVYYCGTAFMRSCKIRGRRDRGIIHSLQAYSCHSWCFIWFIVYSPFASAPTFGEKKLLELRVGMFFAVVKKASPLLVAARMATSYECFKVELLTVQRIFSRQKGMTGTISLRHRSCPDPEVLETPVATTCSVTSRPIRWVSAIISTNTGCAGCWMSLMSTITKLRLNVRCNAHLHWLLLIIWCLCMVPACVGARSAIFRPFPPPSLRKWPHQKTNKFIRCCHSYARKSASKAVLSRMQLTLRATRSTPHGASRLRASDVCLVGENPTCSVPAL